MRSRTAIGVACLLPVLIACGSKIATARVTRAPADLADGFAEVTVPLPTRQSPMVVAAGDHVIVYGGYRIEGSHESPRLDGADYDIGRGEWTQMPPAPFTRPLHLAAGVWTGREVIVVGTPCGATTTEIYEATCDHATVAAAAYSPTTRTWRVLDGPNASLFPGLANGAPMLGLGVGSTGQHAVFTIDTPDPDRQYLLSDANGGTWRFAPGLAGADTVCPLRGAIVGVASGEVLEGGGVMSPNPRAILMALETRTLNTAVQTWGDAVPTPKPASTGAMFERVVCSAGQLAYFPIFPAPVGLDGGGLWFEPDRRRWTQLPRFGATNGPNVGPIAELHGTKVVAVSDSPGSGGSLFLLPAGATAWIRHQLPTSALNSFQALDDLILVVSGDQRDADHMTVGLLDPSRLPAVGR